MSKPLAIFIGPKKTGTSWLFDLIEGSTNLKEVRYPDKIFRKFVYNKYVRDRSILIWPYLIHETTCLNALLQDLENNGRSFRLYFSTRDSDKLISSMSRFFQKYGLDETKADLKANAEYQAVNKNLEMLQAKYSVTTVRIIEPSNEDIKILSEASGVARKMIEDSLGTKVYVGNETSRIKSMFITEMFFRVKAFLPPQVQNITKTEILRKVFFRKKVK